MSSKLLVCVLFLISTVLFLVNGKSLAEGRGPVGPIPSTRPNAYCAQVPSQYPFAKDEVRQSEIKYYCKIPIQYIPPEKLNFNITSCILNKADLSQISGQPLKPTTIIFTLLLLLLD
jgi:hypothetical protein